MRDGDDSAMERLLHRIEVLVSDLDALPDRSRAEPARELLGLVLDLHGLALARLMAIVVAGDPEMLARAVSDGAIRPALLLHGLHPETTEERVRRAVEGLRPELAAQGVGLVLRQGGASVRLLVTATARAGAGSLSAQAIRREIEAAVVAAAPDVEDIVIDGIESLESAGLAL